MKVDILAIGVHPDDIELGCSGTIMHHLNLGHTVGLLDLTRGELGSRGNAIIRRQEAKDALKIMGASFREALDLGDGFFDLSERNLKQVIQILRKCQPEIVLANAIRDRHPDHGRAAKLISDACFLSGLIRVETYDENGDLQEKWRPKAIYHYIQDHTLHPDLVVDITPYIEQKIAAILAFKTQFYDASDDGSEPQTPISGIDFLESVKAKNRVHGRYINASFGEGFNVERPLGVKNLLNLD